MSERTEPLTEEQIASCFAGPRTSTGAILALFAATVPDWANVETMLDSGAVHSETWKHICGLMIDRDHATQAEHMAGGPWMNYGFSQDDTVEPWQIRAPRAEYKTS